LATTNNELECFEHDIVSQILETKTAEHFALENNLDMNFRPGTDDFEEVLELIMRESKGNPFWVMNFVNIFKVVVAKGEHKKLFDTSFSDAAKSEAFGVLNRVILIEFDSYSSAQQELLKTASTIGTVFEIRILKKVLPVTFRRKHNFEAQMKLLIEIGVIQNYEHEKKDWFCEFVHDITRRAIESLIPPSKLSMIHKQVAETYEYFYQDDLRPLFPRLAYHYDKSGMANESFVYLRLAATTELQLDSVKQGIDMLERAIAVINNINENLESKMQKVEQLVMLLRSCLKDAGFSEEFLVNESETHDHSIIKSLTTLIHHKYHKLLVVLRNLQQFQKSASSNESLDSIQIKRKVSSWKIMPGLQAADDQGTTSGDDSALVNNGSVFFYFFVVVVWWWEKKVLLTLIMLFSHIRLKIDLLLSPQRFLMELLLMRLPIRSPWLSETRPKTKKTRRKQLFSALFCKVSFLRTTRYVMVGTFVS
jgi:hypothetical protein